MRPVRPASAPVSHGKNEIDLSRFGVVSTMHNASSLGERLKAAEWAANFAARNEDPEISRALLSEIKLCAEKIDDPVFKTHVNYWLHMGQTWAAQRHPELSELYSEGAHYIQQQRRDPLQALKNQQAAEQQLQL